MLAAQSSPVSAIVFAVVVLATSLALVAGLAWASRRLLGLPVGALRALIAGLLGFASRPARAPGRVHHRGAGCPAGRRDDLSCGGGSAGAQRDGAAAVGGDPRHTAGGCALTALRADQPYRGAAWPGPVPARAGAAPRGRGWRAGGARAVAAACPGGGRGDLYQAGPAAVHPPRSAPEGIHFRTRPAPGPGRAGALGTGRKGDSRVAGGAGWAGFRRAGARAGRRRIDRPGAQGPAA